MSRYTAEVAENLDVQYIVDFGAGLGHLARSLAYGYKLNVCCLEKEPEFTKQARYMKENTLVRRFFSIIYQCIFADFLMTILKV